MKTYLEECTLLDEQRSLIVRGIQEGKKEYQSIKALLPEFTTNTYAPRLQYDAVNSHVERMILSNPHTQMKVFKKKAGFHPYIVIQDTIRNILILVSKLPKNKYIYNPSGYRGDFASSNFDRLLDAGAPKEDLMGDTIYQPSLFQGPDNHPFGIVISYDRDSDVIYEGALRPDQEEWIYKEDITDSIIDNTKGIIPLNNYRASDIEPRLKTPKEDSDIVVKLKNSPST
ncbi:MULTISPECIES: hypothetical protein [unclassified Paenibacillus]|uniref:hypothetical protein n=1 Tax=unclassified Paenibacillus TaxID=185978 RepID=UPI001AE76330|nr:MULTISPECIES: hypothetical protein [unclassified Paenibacillus]MBP1153965.1 hypothetical protein [Paenibacillus sp. PvP091]MBP1170650.1 hypothetical protein [Paenibacillus sp. PvR098]MBP2441678.1 hypothetical protein [Paenibacillus sp. PvP052]